MKTSLQLKIGQQLTMTPQLQQAIRLLQLSTLDLQQEIQQALYSNPLLEMVDEVDQPGDNRESETTPDRDNSGETESRNDTGEESWDNDIPTELAVDTSWEDIYQSAGTGSSGSQSSSGDSPDFETVHTVTESLADHLIWQLNLTPFSDTDRVVAMALIDAIEPTGMLGQDLEEIHQSMGGDEFVEMDEIVAVLHRLQHFDPPGVGARTVAECLLIQLNQFAPDTPYLAEARVLVKDHLPLVAERDLKQLERRTGYDEELLRHAIRLIQTLRAHPGDAISSGDMEYVIPDIRVRKKNGVWRVSLTSDSAPRICINEQYAKLVQRADNSDQNQFLRNHLQEARWFLRSLESRNDTLLRVAGCIVDMQKEFLDHGPVAMRPMILADVAERLELHESTISRVTTQKYIDTPQGIFELKYFFSSHVSTSSGGECSSTAIRAMLKTMIAEEDPAKPLSDSKLANLLCDKGIEVARRTVAKYRESLGIASSSERKRIKQKF